MARARSASRSGRRLLPIVLVTMLLLVAVFIILIATAHAAPYTALYVRDIGLRTTGGTTPRHACDQAALAAVVCRGTPISTGRLRRRVRDEGVGG